jgi:hypothetical protein
MPVTIGTVTSNVNIVDRPGGMDDDTVQQIVKLVLAQLSRNLQADRQSQEESEVRDRKSIDDRF